MEWQAWTPKAAENMACTAQLTSCCCCNLSNSPARCPEWEIKEILVIIAADFRIASLAALLSIMYEVGGLFTGYLCYKHLQLYRCEYI
jgi:hypothetical protein